MHEYNATVDRVKDGDTFVLMIDQGFGNYTKQSIRVLDYSAPELRTANGPAYRDAADTVLRSSLVIAVRTYKDARTFERWLAEIWVDGVDFKAAMSARGFKSEGKTPREMIEEKGGFVSMRAGRILENANKNGPEIGG